MYRRRRAVRPPQETAGCVLHEIRKCCSRRPGGRRRLDSLALSSDESETKHILFELRAQEEAGGSPHSQSRNGIEQPHKLSPRIGSRSLSAGAYSRDPLARKDDVEGMGATNRPDGQISKNLSSLPAKNIPLSPSGKSPLCLRTSHPLRGALRTSRTRGEMRWTRWRARRNALIADGEVVWSWRPGAGAKFAEARLLQMTVARKPVTGESTK
jgi:hypothetical protein